MWGWLGPLLKLMGFVADQVRRLQRRQEQEKRDHEQSEIQDDPVEFGRNHFNRVRDPSDMPDTADTTSEAGAGKLDDKQSGRRES
jgi:hypothetical protein